MSSRHRALSWRKGGGIGEDEKTQESAQKRNYLAQYKEKRTTRHQIPAEESPEPQQRICAPGHLHCHVRCYYGSDFPLSHASTARAGWPWGAAQRSFRTRFHAADRLILLAEESATPMRKVRAL
jgi:hypothetical protein